MKRLYVESYGCTQNTGEARLMAERAASLGYRVTSDEAEADVHLLVTCTVVEATERAMVKRMRALDRYGTPLIVAGCMASAQRRKVLDIVPRAKLLPPRRWPQIVELLEADTACGDAAADVESQEATWRDAIVPIAQGCAGRCTYCITRVARGRVSSYGQDDLVAQVATYVAAGVREIKLTGQDTAAYGMDRGTNLAELVDAITGIPGEFRVRVGMADPLTILPILDRLIRAYRSDTVYKFLHLPVQSGDDEVLAAMRRDYTVADFQHIVAVFREAYPELTVSTDIIVGFPGETEPQFERSLDLVREVRPDIVNVTRFSVREGTPAASMPGQVVGWRAKERSRRLSRLRFEIARDLNGPLVGRVLRVLTTEPGKEGTTLARTDAYKQIVLPGVVPIGEFVQCRIVEARAVDLVGELI